MTRDLAGRAVLLTGATEGIGKAAAAEFAARGAALIIVGRDSDKGGQTARLLRATTGNEDVHCLIGDLSKFSGVRAVASAFRRRHERLDILVNNAGALFSQRAVNEDGVETTFALNHMAYFGLTTQLWDLITTTPGARVVNTASSAHVMGKLDLQREAGYGGRGGFAAYCDSKLANILFTKELARRLAPFGATANCMHPGFVRSGFGCGTGGLLAGLMRSRLASRFARSPEQGADTLLWLATSPAASMFNGEYFIDRKISPVAKAARDTASAAELWAFSDRLFRLAAPPCPRAAP